MKRQYQKPKITQKRIKAANFLRSVADESLLAWAACCSEVPPCEVWQLCAN